MQSDNIQEFFRISSRVALVIPVAAVIIALAMRYHVFDRNEPVLPATKQIAQAALPTPAISSTASAVISSPRSLNFSGDIVCGYGDIEASISALKKNNNILFRKKTRKGTGNYLVNGDCLYVWEQGAYGGQKVCGIGQYVGMAQSLFSSGLIDVNTFMKFLPQGLSAAPTGTVSAPNINALLATCVNREVSDPKIFEVPKYVVFVEAKKK